MEPESEFKAAPGEKVANGFAVKERKKMEEEFESDPELDKDDAFEFNFDCCDFPASPVSADVVFLDWKMKQRFPLISSEADQIEEVAEMETSAEDANSVASSRRETAPLRKLMELEKEFSFSSSSSESDEIESLAAGSYCIWNPAASASAENGGKGRATGPWKRWKLRDLLRNGEACMRRARYREEERAKTTWSAAV